MKTAVILFALIGLSQFAFADEPAVECKPALGSGNTIYVKVDRGHGSQWQDSAVTSGASREIRTSHQVVRQPDNIPNEIHYWGNDFDLSIDTWATGRPEMNFNYPSRFTSSAHNGGNEATLDCQFLPF